MRLPPLVAMLACVANARPSEPPAVILFAGPEDLKMAASPAEKKGLTSAERAEVLPADELCPGHPHILKSSSTCEGNMASTEKAAEKAAEKAVAAAKRAAEKAEATAAALEAKTKRQRNFPTLQHINSLFENGQPSNNLDEAGLIVHTLDGTERGDAPWMPCNRGVCKQFSWWWSTCMPIWGSTPRLADNPQSATHAFGPHGMSGQPSSVGHGLGRLGQLGSSWLPSTPK